jgi:hypothetical protein
MAQFRITLIRHGKPLCDRPAMLSADAYQRWLNVYDAAEVYETPPTKLSAILNTERTQTLLCSGMRRSISSAYLLLPEGRWQSLSIFNEAPVAVPSLLLILPTPIWTALGRILWLLGRRSNESPRTCRSRAHSAADLMLDVAKTSDVVLVGHGWMNRMIINELRQRGLKVYATSGAGYWRCVSLSR